GWHAVLGGRLLDQQERLVERVPRPEIPILELVHVLLETAVPFPQPAVEEHGLDREVIVVPEGEAVKALAMARDVEDLFVLGVRAIHEAGLRLPCERIRAAHARGARRRAQHSAAAAA